MDMKRLLEDFKAYVDQMDDVSIKKSIDCAIQNSANSYILNGESVERRENKRQFSVKKHLQIRHTLQTYGFCSGNRDDISTYFNMSEENNVA